MVWWQLPLYPFAILYDLITRFRNHLYNIGSSPSFDFETNVISIGNLSVGGTGKTPMVHLLTSHLLNKGKKIAILSRGYGRKTTGFRVVGPNDTSDTVGDESLNYFRLFGEKVLVSVGENRAMSIPLIVVEQCDNDVILLDDAFQHRSVRPAHSILLTTYSRPFYRDYLLPAGTLRESRRGAKRADTIIMTGCPRSITDLERQQMVRELRKFNDRAPLYFTTKHYHEAEPIFPSSGKKERVVLLAGIANVQSFFQDISVRYNVVEKLSFSDHHGYTRRDIRRIMAVLHLHDAMLICTEKDAVKLVEFKELASYNCFSIQYHHAFLDEEDKFLKTLDLSLQTYHREYGPL